MTELERLLKRAGINKKELARLYPCAQTAVTRWNKKLPDKVKNWLEMYIEIQELKFLLSRYLHEQNKDKHSVGVEVTSDLRGNQPKFRPKGY